MTWRTFSALLTAERCHSTWPSLPRACSKGKLSKPAAPSVQWQYYACQKCTRSFWARDTHSQGQNIKVSTSEKFHNIIYYKLWFWVNWQCCIRTIYHAVICIFNWRGISEEVGEVHVHKMRNKFSDTNKLFSPDWICVVNWLENAINHDLSHVTLISRYEYVKLLYRLVYNCLAAAILQWLFIGFLGIYTWNCVKWRWVR